MSVGSITVFIACPGRGEGFMVWFSVIWNICFAAALFCAAISDGRKGKIPNEIPFFLLCLGMTAGIVWGGWDERLVGVITGSLPFIAAALLWPGSFGGGDWKLMAAAGSCLGGRKITDALFWGFLFALAAGMWRRRNGRRGRFPIGPWLCAGIFLKYFMEM